MFIKLKNVKSRFPGTGVFHESELYVDIRHIAEISIGMNEIRTVSGMSHEVSKDQLNRILNTLHYKIVDEEF